MTNQEPVSENRRQAALKWADGRKKTAPEVDDHVQVLTRIVRSQDAELSTMREQLRLTVVDAAMETGRANDAEKENAALKSRLAAKEVESRHITYLGIKRVRDCFRQGRGGS